MSFLSRAVKGEQPSSSGDIEELYERLFPKIGRDFIYKEDLFPLLDAIVKLIDPLGVTPLDLKSDIYARIKAAEYKAVLDAGLDGSKIYIDLINLDDD